MDSTAIGAVEGLLFEMRTTNVRQGLKVLVHERWIETLARELGAVKAERAELLNKLASYEELAASALVTQGVADSVVKGKKR